AAGNEHLLPTQRSVRPALRSADPRRPSTHSDGNSPSTRSDGNSPSTRCTRSPRLLTAALLAALASAPVSAVWAQPASSGAAQREEFAAAQKLFDDKDYAGALPKFQKLVADTSSPNARLYVARCLRELGRLVEAYDQMSLTVKESMARAESEARYAQTRDAAASELVVLEARVGKLIVAITGSEDAKVTVDGKELPRNKLGTPVTVAPGTVTVVATAPGSTGMREKAEVKAGETKTVALNLGTGTASSSAAPSGDGAARQTPDQPETPDEPGATRGGGVRTAGFVTAGVGVAGMVLFAVSAIAADNEFSTLEEECHGQRCTEDKYADTVDSGKTWDMLANVGLVVGIVGISAGTGMILFGGPKPAEGGTALSVGPTGFRLRGTF
ncbi:MAG: hypothetical protein WKG00_32540, partial [Polyangiaceae bacterium]